MWPGRRPRGKLLYEPGAVGLQPWKSGFSLANTDGAMGQVKAMVYGVTLLSIVVQGVTIGPLTRALLSRVEVTPGPAAR